LWQLLALNIAAALLRQALPRSGDLLGRLSADSDRFPGRYFTILLALSTAAYLPFALKYRPWDWSEIGPFSFQSGRVLHYVVYFFAGAGVGVYGLDRGLLRADGMLARHWRRWLAGAIGAFIVWMLTTALTLERPDIVFQIAAETAFAVSSATACFCFGAVFLRFANRKWPKFFEALSNNSYGIYLVHYVFVIWLQYLLLGIAIFAIIKGLLVFGSALALSWAVVAAFSRIAQLGGARREKSHGVA
jgi:surface polysaccharide O-acyltransferase-like enzyme